MPKRSRTAATTSWLSGHHGIEQLDRRKAAQNRPVMDEDERCGASGIAHSHEDREGVGERYRVTGERGSAPQRVAWYAYGVNCPAVKAFSAVRTGREWPR